MTSKNLDKEIVVRISTNEFDTLVFLSQKLDMSLSQVIRSLIPKLPYIHPISQTSPKVGALEILNDYDRSRLSEILSGLISQRKAVTLAKEIKAQLIDPEHKRNTLTGTTEHRLIRWARPARDDERTRYVSPKAQEICEIIYGFIPDRTE
jgi:hypothetical protein